MEQALEWTAGLVLVIGFLAGLVWLSGRLDLGGSEGEEAQDAVLDAARKVVKCRDGKRADCPRSTSMGMD